MQKYKSGNLTKRQILDASYDETTYKLIHKQSAYFPVQSLSTTDPKPIYSMPFPFVYANSFQVIMDYLSNQGKYHPYLTYMYVIA